MVSQGVTEISRVVKDSGVVGAGGAGFPTHVKISAAVDTVIVNGAECEPLLASDKYLMETQSDKIVRGLEYIMEASGAKRGYIALKEKYSLPLQAISKSINGKYNISVSLIGDYYPAGDEFLLVHEVTERIVPEGDIPPKVGCLVENVETTFNIFEAVENNLPVIFRFLTCTGEVKIPSIVKAHIGTSFREIIDLCGGTAIEDPVLVVGGPLMGRVETDLEAPVTKTTNGIIVLPRDHEIVWKKTLPVEHIVKLCKSVCCQCTYCTELCPRFLLGHVLQPHLIMRQIGYGVEVPPKTIANAFLCSGCGLCEIYACVMGLSPNIINTMIKDKLSAQGFTPYFPDRKITINFMKEYRKIPTERLVNRLRLTKYSVRTLRRGIETNPTRVEILLRQHTGKAAIPVVTRGATVKEGTLIAEIPQDALGAAVHSSIEGKVMLIDTERIIIQR